MVAGHAPSWLPELDQYFDPEINLEWQLATIRGIEQLGIKVIRLNSFDLAENVNQKILDQIELSEFRLDIQKEVELNAPTSNES